MCAVVLPLAAAVTVTGTLSEKMKTAAEFPQTFAIVTDRSRPAGLRVARVFVVNVLDALDGAEVEEMAMRRLTHYLPLTRMAKGRRAIAARLRALVEEKRNRSTAKPAPVRKRIRGLWYQDNAA